jgi:uncharacterized membrane protein
MFALNLRRLITNFKSILGMDQDSAVTPAGRAGKVGVVASSVFMFIVAGLMALLSNSTLALSTSLAIFGVFLLTVTLSRNLTRSRTNALALIGHMCALFSFYLFFTRIVNVTYVTDSIVGTYMGVVKVMQFQNPYAYSIKSLLDQLGFPPSFYTPRVDGTFEFHLNYPAMNFLALIPSYLAGLHDLRDGVFIFHLASVLLVFSLIPSRWKALSLAPFAFGFPLAIGYSWTDSVWAFFILLTAVLWRRNKGASLLSFGLAAATKQIALVAAPFLLIRLWNEAEGSRAKTAVKGLAWILAGFLVPNLPFIIGSPAAWWTGTVGPYLPSTAPLIPGGIGLSELLPDLGLVLSPTYFTILTVIASVACITLFIRHYSRLNRFLWAMPVAVLFFYPRSFPNYIVYWAFPYLFEWFRYGNPSLNLLWIRSIVSHYLRAPGWNLQGVAKRRVGPALLVILTLTAVLAGASGAYVAQVSKPKLDLRVDGMMDPDNLGLATGLNISVTNYGFSSVVPRFFVKWFFLWDLWNTNSSGELSRGSTSTYVLTATDALAGVPRGYSFRVAVYDSVSWEFLGESRSYTSVVSRPSVANPRFTWWTLDIGTGRQVPPEWRLSLTNIVQNQGGITVADTNASEGVDMWLNSSSSQSSARELRLSQRFLFNETNLMVQVLLGSSIGSLNGAVFGVEATDGVHSLDYLLSPTAAERTMTNFDSNTTIILPVKNSTWQSISVDIQASWAGQGWNSLHNLYVSFFLRSSQPGFFTTYIMQVTSVT